MNEDYIVRRLANTHFESALVWAKEQKGSTTSNPPGLDDQDRNEALQEFVKLGLISDQFSLANEWDLTSRGRRIAERLEQSRASGDLRWETIERAILRYVDEGPEGGRQLETKEVTKLPINGPHITEREFRTALRALRDREFITGNLMTEDRFDRAKLTTQGRDAMNHFGSPADFSRSGGTTYYDNRHHIENSGHMGNAVVGNNAVQRGNHFTDTATHITVIQDAIEELRQALSSIQDVPENAISNLEDLDREAHSPNPEPEKLNGFFTGVVAAIATKLGEEAYAGIGDAIGQVAAAIGQMT